MAMFQVALSEESVASQIAGLLNTYNKLHRKHNAYSIIYGQADYFVETRGDLVLGCVGLVKTNSCCTRIKHLCVHENYRKLGLATKLLQLAIDSCDSKYVSMTVRDDNTNCLLLALKFGFKNAQTKQLIDYNLLTLGRYTRNVR